MERRDALLVTVNDGPTDMAELAAAVNVSIAEVIHQSLDRPDPRAFLGPGRLDELAQRLRGELRRPGEDPLPDVDVVLVAGELRPAQVLRMQAALGVEVWDRVRLILAIFEDRARSREARVQVELARLRWELPLVKEAIHLQKTGERPGFQAGGEMAYTVYQEHVQRRMARLRDQLEQVADQRAARQRGRHRGRVQLSLAGYTNAGKTTLLNALTAATERTEHRFFSTLETRTRAVELRGLHGVLLTDTVGFVEDLPPWLVEAFQATLEEVIGSDAVLLAVDQSEPLAEVRRKAEGAARVLIDVARRAEVRPAPLVLVFTKTDLHETPDEDLAAIAATAGAEAWCKVSSRTRAGMREAVETALDALPDRRRLDLCLPGAHTHRVDDLNALGVTWLEKDTYGLRVTMWVHVSALDELEELLVTTHP